MGETHGNGASNPSALEGPNGSTLSGSAESLLAPSVGGGHKKRALAHGYSMSTPSGFEIPLSRE